jgi:preprotein translocase SecE subunit
MAEEPTPTKRRLRAASAETVRERTAKLQDRQARTGTSGFRKGFSSFWWGFGWPLRQLARPIRWLGRFKVIGVPARIIGRILLPRYIRNSWGEIRLVSWPSFKQTWRLTYAVIVFSIIFGVIIFFVDFGLNKLFKEFIIK